MSQERCYACGRILRGKPRLVDTRDDQKVYVGPDCYKKIEKAGEAGYKVGPGVNGVRLYIISER